MLLIFWPTCILKESLNAFISMWMVSVWGIITVARFLQGIFNSRPPQPRYTAFWDVGVVIKGLGANRDLSLKELTMKTVMLLAIMIS